MEVDISLVDFPFVCRICLIRGELRLFEEDNCLWDLFLAITKIDVSSTVNFPKNICNECINKLKDISWFIDVSNNDPGSGKKLIPKTGSIEYPGAVRSGMNQESFENKEDISVQIFQLCRICSSPRSLILCEEKSSLIELFRTITNIDVQTDINFWSKSSICNECVNKLEKISSFIDLLFYNNRKLQNAINRNETIKTESYSDGNAFDVGLSSCEEMKVDLNEIKVERPDENSSHYESNDISAMIDIKEENFDSELVASIEQNYQNGLELGTQSQLGKKIVHLQRHLLVHTKDKPFKCDCCKKRFIRKANFNRHMLTHTAEKSFKCACCQKQFTQASHLEMHMFTHTGEKPFTCDCCEKQFTRARYLKQHMLTHSGEKPFKCDICQKGFGQKGDLKKHTLTHTREKPFNCYCCKKSFGLKGSLNQHMLTHSHWRIAVQKRLLQKFQCER